VRIELICAVESADFARNSGALEVDLGKEVKAMIKSIEGESDFKSAVLESKSPVFVDFWAQWCGPCLATAPVVEELATEYSGKIDFAKVDVDANGPLAVKYGIASIPTMIVFRDGKPVQQVIGYKAKKELKQILDDVLAQ
jgi:thioredoxin 1